ncbi:MAG: 2'-5' RNA ligase family protein [Reichenbachiella sp.]|uniref:2'-5' RNA ligase family protein n=1 Tax=Reichenbachiella sp. TaxID=2184521 RepID=UPI0032633FB2
MNESSDTIYNDLWKAAQHQFSQGTHSIDPYLDTKEDLRRGVTLLARPDDNIITRIQDFQDRLRELEPNQYYYPAPDVHLTVLSIISCHKGFLPNKFDASGHIELIQSCLSDPIEVMLRGVTASPSGVLVQGFSDKNELNSLRDRLRTAFRSSHLENTIDKRYKINTAHLTVMRFRKPMTNPQKVLNLLNIMRGDSFGKMKIHDLHLVSNDWYQSAKKVNELNTFKLG